MILITYFNQPFQNLEKREEIKRKIAIENDDYDLSAALCLNKKNGLNPIDINKYLELQLSFKFPTNHNVYLFYIIIEYLYNILCNDIFNNDNIINRYNNKK